MNLSRDEIDEIAKTTAERILGQSNRLIVDPTRMVCTPRLKELKEVIKRNWLADETVAAVNYRQLAKDLDEAGLNVNSALQAIADDELSHYTTLAAIVQTIETNCRG